MNNLPREISEKIFTQLHQKDKVECLTVCRAWKNTLEDTVLFQVVRLRSTEQFDKLIEKMGREPCWRQRVERLIIEMTSMTSKEIDCLPFLLPNIQEMVLYPGIDVSNLRFIKLLSPHTWSKSIKCIKEQSSHLITHHILKGVCPILTEIVICGQSQRIEKEFISLIKNAPELIFLTIQSFVLDLADLELLHENASSVSSLSLKYITINSLNIPAKIEPANSVTKLFMCTQNAFLARDYIIFFKYLARKYTNVTSFAYKVYVNGRANYEECMAMGTIPYIQQIAPYLTALKTVDCSYIQYVFPTLDKNSCHLKKVNIPAAIDMAGISKIVESNQAQSIEKFTMNQISDNSFMEHLSKLTTLTTLHLRYVKGSSSHKITINSLLRTIGATLTTLALEEANIVFDSSPIQPCPSFKTLILRSSIIPKSIDLRIYHAFPNLRTLVMDRCSWATPFFYFGHLNMSCIELRGSFPSGNEHVLVVTACNDERRFYTADKVSKWNTHPNGPATDFPAIKYLPIDKFNGVPCVTFICNSLYSFIMVNTSI